MTVSLRDPRAADNIPHTYGALGVISLDGYVSPSTRATNGHYQTDLKINGSWFRIDDDKISQLSKTNITKKAVVLCYTKFYV